MRHLRGGCRKKGILPPDKPKLNRKKFIEEAQEQFLGWDVYQMLPYLSWGIREMLEKMDRFGRCSLEAVGVAKAIRLAAEREKLEKEKRQEGAEGYTVGELIERVKSIYDA